MTAKRNPFAKMTLDEAQASDLWPCVEVTRVEGGELEVAVALDLEVKVKVPDAPEDLSTVAVGEFVRERLVVDFQELSMVIHHKVDFTLLAA